jgi:hypothetical protein
LQSWLPSRHKTLASQDGSTVVEVAAAVNEVICSEVGAVELEFGNDTVAADTAAIRRENRNIDG